jgi:serine phosphatase RsbU (regulator of sigma subunit)
LHTDGLSELERPDETAFVPERLEAVVRATKHLSAKEICRAVLDAAMEFAPLKDDLTLVIIKKVNGGR